MFFHNQSLDKQYPEFHAILLEGNVTTIKEKLKNTPLLAKYNKSGEMSPVISAIHHSFSHQNALQVLDVLKEYDADFNSTYFESDLGFELNPIAWLLLQGGDSRLIQKLADCGTDTKHPSIDKVKKIISANKNKQEFDYPTPYQSNPYECSPSQLVAKL